MSEHYLQWARAAMHTESHAIKEVADSLDTYFTAAIQSLLTCKGRVIVMGMGKSGHIGRKAAATLASTGTPAFFVHPAEAAHGDLGMVADNDVILALSNSGESDEIVQILPALKRKRITLIGITSKPHSTMARHADIHITASVSQEACPLGLAPTSSTTAVLALCDALAVVLLQARRFTPDDFALSHPAGSLGRRLLTTVADIMVRDDAVPSVVKGTLLKTALFQMSEKGLGMLAVVDETGCLKGIVTDGDLRRLFETRDHFADLKVDDVMKHNPITLPPERLASEAIKLMEEKNINGLLVCDTHNQLLGALNMNMLLHARVY
ncbi:MAG: KpsF/GutQ family sugar-phosphate isomerase [Alysiella sp.]|uniref:KpsF/GutQ family sugar-phosphate isomerase n=1 Tax=Alysiella sp. TaxID=1872483 RepID=UPI0026DB5936|nr:KpsF/GutQ family sugar-phosphate isomerase [Alysiella sp.]MDO4434488.1 KpsF/GutQ family sugar-phosphate isomerase [Alysiella sp.]